MGLKLLAFVSLFALCANGGPASERADAVDPTIRVDCGPDPNIDEGICKSRGCSWSPLSGNFDKTIPWCHYPRNTGYTVASSTANGYRLTKAESSPGNAFGGDTSDIKFEQYSMGGAVRLVIGADDSFVPTDLDLNRKAEIKTSDPLIVKTTNAEIFSFTVERKESGVRIWDTSIGGMLFGKQYIQLATLLPTKNIYGFGEHIHDNLQHDMSRYTTWPMFARDQPPNFDFSNTMNLYGVHNFYLGLEDDGKAHGVFVLNTNAQEVTTGPGPHLVYRAIGGRFEVFIFPGPTPEEVIRQYQQVIGNPYLPAYWAFGYQLARYGFKSLDDLKGCVQRIRDAKIPFDVIMPDIDYMDRYKDFTVNPKNNWPGLGAYAKLLKASGMHMTIMLDAAIEVDYAPFQRAMDQGANFISWPRADLVQRDINNKYPLTKDTDYMLGVVWPDNHITFPDFYDDTGKTARWWTSEIKTFHEAVEFEGIWIDMNEPSNFGTNDNHPWYFDNPDHPNDTALVCKISGPDSTLDFPPYRTQAAYLYGGYNGLLCGNTVCMNGVVNRGKQTIYDVKNLFGLTETIATQQALYETTGKRGQVVGRSTFPSSGRFGGKWLGDNSAKFQALRSAIIGTQEFNLFGIPQVGSDVCGFLFKTTEELCLRWHQAGAFHSFYRNHNDIKSPDQDPPQWPSVAAATRTANLFRYEHLPYLYSLHVSVSLLGGTVIRPVFFEFPTDFQTFNLNYQFMWGPAMIVAPAVYENVDSIDAYLPPAADWYPLYGNSYGVQAKTGHSIIEAPRNSTAPVFVRGGYIVPRQEPGLTTMGSHQNEFRLLIALNTKTSPIGAATGEMYWDDGVSGIDPKQSMQTFEHYHFKFNYTSTDKQGQLVIQLVKKPTSTIFLPALDQIEVLGYPSAVSFKDAKVNGKDAKLSLKDCSYDAVTKVLRLQRPGAGIVFLNDHLDSWTVTWPNSK